jgi:SAM-dependent methyltransferase
MTANATTITRWNAAEGEQWSRHQARYDRMLAPYGGELLAAAALRRGERVLDVGCGSGATTVAAARAVGGTGRATGLDVSEPLLAAARRRAEATAGAEAAEFVTADAQTFPFVPAGYDVLVSRFGLMLFDDPPAAFVNLARALRTGGRLAFVTWRDAAANGWFTIPLEVLHAGLGTLPSAPEGPCAFSLADPARVVDLVEGAGFERVRLEAVPQPVTVGDDPDDAVAFYDDAHGDALRAILDAPALEVIRDRLTTELARWHDAEGVRVPAAAWLVTAQKR